MRELDTRQKKIIKWFSISFILIGVLGLSITWLYFIVNDWTSTKEQIRLLIAWLFTNFGSLAFGIFLKYLANKLMLKNNKREIEQLHIDYGLTKQWKEASDSNNTTPQEKTPKNCYFRHKKFYFIVEKNGEIKIIYTPKDKINDYKDLKEALNEFIEKVRLDLPTQMI